MRNEFNFHKLKSADRLPSPPGSVLAILRLMQSDNPTAERLAELIQVDPALAGRILKIANSAAFGMRRPSANIKETVLMLGMRTVQNLALGISLIGKYQAGHCRSFNYAAFWSESLAMAVAIAALTARERSVPPEEAFTLGLLANIGSLALATAWPDQYSQCLDAAQGEQLLVLEQERFAVDRQELSLALLADWGLTDLYRTALKQSFQPRSDDVSSAARLACQLVLASQIARYCLADEDYRCVLFPDLMTQADRHHLDEPALCKLIEGVIAQWRERGSLIDIKTEVYHHLPVTAVSYDASNPGLDVLLVDDEPMMLARLTKQLTAIGFQVSSCRDGDAALKHIVEQQPRLVISDWRMKPMNGLQLCKTLRNFDFGKSIYFIMMTAAETDDELVEAFDAGIDDYVTKPVNVRVLIARIRAAQRIIALQQDLLRERKELELTGAKLGIANKRLEQMANTDLLTRLPNRRYAMKRLEQEWQMVQRTQSVLSVLMLDLDHFKSINDTLGHDAGDQVLAHAAKIMRAVIRAGDIACRMGGEEFLVIAPNTDGAAALLLGERICKAIETQQIKTVSLPSPLTISIGAATSKDNRPGWNELIKYADHALYQVKNEGRNGAKLLRTQ